MAVRFSADGQDYTRTMSLGTQAALTVATFFKISVDRNDYSTIFSIDNGTGDNWVLQSGVDGTTVATVFDASTQQGMGSVAVGVWYYVCLATGGTTGTLYHKVVGAPTLTAVAVTSVTASVSATTLRIGESPWGAEWLNGCVAGFRFWTTQLTRAEAEVESQQHAPSRAANLVEYHPFQRAEALDHSGNGRSLSGGTGTTTEDGPPVPMQRVVLRRRWLDAPAGGPVVLRQAVETSTSTALARSKVRSVGQATETDTGQALSRTKFRTLGQAAETDTATPPARAKSRLVGQGAETDTATTLARTKSLGVGIASEVDTSTTLGRSKRSTVGQAAESSTANPVSVGVAVVLGQATETDTAAALGRAKTRTVGQSAETDTAASVARTKVRTVGQVTETDSAAGLTLGTSIALGQATETTAASPMTRAKALRLDAAHETSVAAAMLRLKVVVVGPAAETSTAITLARVKAVAVGLPVEVDAAHPLGGSDVPWPLTVDPPRSRTSFSASIPISRPVVTGAPPVARVIVTADPPTT